MEIEKPNSAGRFIGTMAEKLGAVARAATIFGEPVERDRITVIPVARAQWGFGGGAGHRKGGDKNGTAQEGAGGGGGVRVSPVGFIEIKNGEAQFRRIRTVSVPLLIAGGLSLLLLLSRSVRR